MAGEFLSTHWVASYVASLDAYHENPELSLDPEWQNWEPYFYLPSRNQAGLPDNRRRTV